MNRPDSPVPSTLPVLRALLQGDRAAWPDAADDAWIAGFLREARWHGVVPLVAARLHPPAADPASSAAARCHDVEQRIQQNAAVAPEPIRRAVRDEALVQAMREKLLRAQLRRVAAALAQPGIDALLMKGTALAYGLYPDPALRPRADTDIVVAPTARAAAQRALHDLGYRRGHGPAGSCVGYQVELSRVDTSGETTLDLHWRVSNAQSFAWLFTHAELAASALPVPALGPQARRLGDAHALAVALLHRAGNNRFVAAGFGDRLIWLYDIHLLAAAIGAEDRAHFRDLVVARRIVAIATEGLRHCAVALGSVPAAELADELEGGPEAASGAAFLHAGRARREWLELRAIPTPRARLAYVANRLLPTSDYMRERYPDAAGRALPLLHARRWLEGLGRRRNPRER